MAGRTVEILMAKLPNLGGQAILAAISDAAKACGDTVRATSAYRGGSDVLVLFGVGFEPHDVARQRQVAAGGHAVLWDLGYFGNRKGAEGFMRFSVDRDHPVDLLSAAPADASRWDELGIALREDANPQGHILLVGLGKKSRAYLGEQTWEERKLAELRQRFPDRRIVYRPKPGHNGPPLPCHRDETSPIDDLLRGASLVVVRHSNVAAEAAVAGIPFEAEDGAAKWLGQRDFTPENRRDFLQRLAWFQWRAAEGRPAWEFISGLVEAKQEPARA